MEYQIIRSKRKSLCLMLGRDGVPVVRAPYRVSEEAIQAFVLKHRRWLNRRLAERAALPKFDFGGKVTLFGREYSFAEGRTRVTASYIYLPKENKEAAFVRLLKRMALDYMSGLTDKIAKEHGFKYSAVRVSSAHGRWGSCNAKGNISYSFRVAFLPVELCEYVAVHELCHTRQLNHSARFWKEVEKILPDYTRRRSALKRSSPIMQLFREI